MILSNGFSSDPRVAKEAAALLEVGHEITILAWDRSGSLPKREERDGVEIERIGPAAVHGAGLVNIWRFRAFWREAAGRAVELAPDVLHCHDLDTAPAGLRAARHIGRSARVVLDLHEFYQESPMMPRPGRATPLLRAGADRLERRALARADLVIVVSPGMEERYRGLGVGDRMMVLHNAPDADLFRLHPGEREESGPFVLGYIGAKRQPEPLETLMRIVQRHPDMAVLLAGGGTSAERIERVAEGLERVEVSGPFSYEQAPGLYAKCHAVYAVYDPSFGNVRCAFPVKGGEAMACGLPLVANEGTWFGGYVEEHGIGVTVDALDPADIEAGIVRLKDDRGLAEEMGRRGRRLVESGLSWQAAAERLRKAYQGIL